MTSTFQDEDQDVVVFQRAYVDLLDGDVMAALLLSQIYYWYKPAQNGSSKLRVFKGGKWWLAKSSKDWEEELGMTRKQSRRCMEALVAKGIIVAEVMRFNGSPTVHCRLVAVEGKQVVTDPFGIFDCPDWKIGLSQKGQSITETTAQTTAQLKDASDLAGEQAMTSIQDILKNHEEKKAKTPEGKATSSSVALLWKKRAAALGDGGYVKDLTGKEVGQLKHLVKALGDQTHAVVDWAMQNWPVFSWEVRQGKGLSSAPAVPVVGFLLEHHEIAVQLIAPKPASLKAVPTVAKPEVVVPVEPEEDKAGASDIAATLALLDKLSGT